jgi:hypothetical protein
MGFTWILIQSAMKKYSLLLFVLFFTKICFAQHINISGRIWVTHIQDANHRWTGCVGGIAQYVLFKDDGSAEFISLDCNIKTTDACNILELTEGQKVKITYVSSVTNEETAAFFTTKNIVYFNYFIIGTKLKISLNGVTMEWIYSNGIISDPEHATVGFERIESADCGITYEKAEHKAGNQNRITNTNPGGDPIVPGGAQRIEFNQKTPKKK